jgi:hypothetical protein
MKIHIFKPEEYEGCRIYYRNFHNHFEYLAVINKELYTAHISVKPHWFTKLFYLLGIEKKPYSEQQLKKILTVLRNMAETTIKFIKEQKDNEKT